MLFIVINVEDGDKKDLLSSYRVNNFSFNESADMRFIVYPVYCETTYRIVGD